MEFRSHNPFYPYVLLTLPIPIQHTFCQFFLETNNNKQQKKNYTHFYTIILVPSPPKKPKKGVKSVETNVEAKTVVVDADDSVTPEFMLEKLMKVCIVLKNH